LERGKDMENKTLKSFLDIMEEVFGVRTLTVENEFLFLEASGNDTLSFKVDLFLKYNINGQEQRIHLDEEYMFANESEKIIELKERMERLEIDYNQVVKNEKGKKEWYEIVLTELIEMGIECQTYLYIIALHRIRKNILALEDYFVYENFEKPYDARIFSYERLSEVLKIIEKEHRKLQLGNIYGK
jgi:hypothetical protein